MMKLSRLVLSISIGQWMIISLAYFDFAQHKQPLLWNIGGATSASASPQQPKPKSFAQWCKQKKSVPADTRHTIDILLKKAGTKDCRKADRKLKTLTTLRLYGNNISDVKPLAGLTNLTSLNLGGDELGDRNQISDVKPLAGLTNLTSLDLGKNQISDVKPLAGLTNLTTLRLVDNDISDVKPLAGLTNLTSLDLYLNPLAVKTCPVKPESICKF